MDSNSNSNCSGLIKLKLEDFNFNLPDSLIAQYPTNVRSSSRLLVHSQSGNQNDNFFNLHNYINANDLLVFNDTKVLKARLYGHKDTGGALEALIERIVADKVALVQIKANKAPRVGQDIIFSSNTIDGSISCKAKITERVLPFFKLEFEIKVLDVLDICGNLPLPPYIDRELNDDDEARYQTIFAKNLGAVAAPTASLHFDEALMGNIANKNIHHDYLTLHVGAGTFSPVKHEDISLHVMHTEPYCLTNTLIDSIYKTKQNGGRIIAVGTTALRALESAYVKGKVANVYGETNIFISPGYQFNIVDGLITNFHLPKSTLLMLVSAFIGLDEMKQVYKHAIEHQYRFFSYGDAMICFKKHQT
jgi:S-adenosylmethionine:tRNA ribosyltransferase-isomerase